MFSSIIDAMQGAPDTSSEEASHRTRSRIAEASAQHLNLCNAACGPITTSSCMQEDEPEDQGRDADRYSQSQSIVGYPAPIASPHPHAMVDIVNDFLPACFPGKAEQPRNSRRPVAAHSTSGTWQRRWRTP